MVSSVRNNILCCLSILLNLEVPCSDLCLLHLCNFKDNILRLIITVVNDLQGILVILCHSGIFSADILTFYLFLVCVKPPCLVYQDY